jgi:glyoxylase-like metal-dependent hydrolase (beta-lactamase superfamily II)
MSAAPAGTAGAVPERRARRPEAEAEFWLDPAAASRAPAGLRSLFDIARGRLRSLCGSRPAARLGSAHRQVAPGIEAVALPGHTPGQTGYLIADSGEALLIWGDIVHAGVLQLRRPELAIAFDTDQAEAVVTRRRILDRVTSDRLRVAGMHLPFPGVGHIVRDGAGYAFMPDDATVL